MTGRIPRLVHDGGSSTPQWKRELVADWLRANGIDPGHVCSDATITILPVPFTVAEPDGPAPWQLQVIVFRQYFVGPDGNKELHLITRDPVTFERTVPLRVPFPPPAPGDEGTSHGEAEGQAAQEAPEVLVRDQVEACVSDPRQGARSGSVVPGEAARNESAAEEGAGCSHEAVPEPEEEVGNE